MAKLMQFFKDIIDVYRDAVKNKAGPISPSCGVFLFILSYASSKARSRVTIVDIGAGYGISTAFLAKAPNVKVYAIEKNEIFCQQLEENLEKLGLKGIVEVVCENFLDFAKELNPVDIIFIDVGGNVSPEVVSSAVEILKKDGILLIHDAVTHVTRIVDATRLLKKQGFIYSFVSIDTGLLVASCGIDIFWHLVREVYMTSIREMIHPIGINTAKFLFSLSKLILDSNRNAVDVGAGYGVSTFSMALASYSLEAGHVYAIEKNIKRANFIKEVSKKNMLDKYITVINEDVKFMKDEIGNISLLFLDAMKEEYLDYLKRFEKALIPGALIIAHNTISHADVLKNYLEYVYQNYVSITTMTDYAGITISLFR